MASPFAVFRKNQKTMLAVAGVVIIMAFVFGDPLVSYMGGRGTRQQENPVVVETRYGDLRDRDLEGLRYQRQIVDNFLLRVIEQSTVKQIGQSNIDSRWLQGMMQQQYLSARGQVMGRSVEGPEAEAVETMVLSERAKQMGLVITDAMINDLIKQLSGDSLSAEELQAIIASLQPQRPVSVPKLFEALRTELLASKYRDLFAQSLADIPPAQRYEYYLRLNRRAKPEVMSLAVADFIGQVADPSDAELKEFYDKYKNRFSDPTSPEPGFKEPKRATFQYFKGNVDEVTEKLKEDVTEEEIRKYYEENKRNFIATSFDDPAATPKGTDDEPESKEGEAPAEEKPGSDEKPAAEGAPQKAPAEPKPEEKPAETPAAEEKPASDEPAAPESPAEEKPAESPAPAAETPAPEAPTESPQADVRSGREFRGAGQTFRLVSMAAQQDEPTAPTQETAPAQEDTPATTEAPAETPPEQPAAEPAAPAAEPKPTDETPADSTTPAEEKPADSEETPATSPGDEIVQEPAVPESPQYEPLEKVQDTIRNTLARQKAAEKLSDQFDELSAKMRRYTDDYDIYTTEKGTNPKAVAPVPLNFAELAEGKDVVGLELKSVTPLQAAREDLGKSFRVIAAQTGAPRTVPFIDFAYADSLPKLKAEVNQDNEGNFYLFWKTDEEPAYVPPLDQVHDKVVRAWKMVKARELARKRAEEYAAQARSLNKPLAELFGKQPELKVAELAPFSWLTLGNVPAESGGLPQLSDVPELDQAGPEFMKTVFGLQPGGLGVAMNVPEDTVYVIRVVEFEPPQEQLRDEFARENPNRYLTAAREDRFKIYESWIADLNKEADVTWLRQADVRLKAPADGEEL